jgi:serine phosphatase RsbU (regulator of sigma subunit)
MAFLEVLEGTHPGRRYPLRGDRVILGRHPDCDVVLEVAAVSRQHAVIIRSGSSFYIEDMGSRNGTFVNSKIVSGRELLRQNDRLKICDLDFVFYMTVPENPADGAGLAGDQSSSMALLIDDDAVDDEEPSKSTVMSALEVASSKSGAFLSARPEVKLAAMMEISQSLGRAVSQEEVLPKLLGSLFKIFVQADRGFVILQANESAPLIPKAVKHRRPSTNEAVRISKTIVRQAMLSKQAILSADAATDTRFDMSQSIADFQIRSLMCVPLVGSDDRALGVIQIDTLDQRSRFNTDDLEVLVSVASQAAIAIENAELHEQTLHQKALQRDLELAHKVQQGLLPSAPPKVSGYHFFNYYEAANQVGGDYYDYIRLSPEKLAVVVGDVSGKGVSAALLMAKLAGEVRFCLASEPDHAAAVCRINSTFASSGWDDRFVTFVLAVIDLEANELTIVNAGHMPPLLRRATGEIIEIGEEEAGLPLGVATDYKYESFKLPIQPGDFLSIFTDGISEAMNTSNDLYGLERLRKIIGTTAITVDSLGQHILDDVRTFVGGRPQSDDMCLACFGRDEH